MRWFYVTTENQDTQGPFKEAEFARLFQTGKINDECFVWNGKTVKDWTQMKSVKGLAEMLQNHESKSKKSKKKGMRYQVGDTLYVLEDGGNLERAVVAKIRDDEMKVHYVGYPSKYDEWIKPDSDRIKSNPSSSTKKRIDEFGSTSFSFPPQDLLEKTRGSTSSQRVGSSRKSARRFSGSHERHTSTGGHVTRSSYSSKGLGGIPDDTTSEDISRRSRTSAEIPSLEIDALERLKEELISGKFALSKYIKSDQDINHQLILELETLNSYVQRYRKERDQKADIIEKQGKELGEIVKKNSSLQMEVDTLEEKKKELENDKKAVRAKLKDLKTIAVDRQILRQLKREIKANREKLEQQNNSIAMQDTLKTGRGKSHTGVRVNHSYPNVNLLNKGDSSQRMAELESKLTEIQAQAERLENDKRGLIEQKEKLEKAQSGHDEDRRRLMKAHEVFNREKDEFVDQQNMLKADNERLKRKEINLKQEVAVMQTKLREKEAQMTVEKENISNMVKEQMKSMKDDLNEAREKTQTDHKKFEEERRRFEGEISQLRKENAVLKAENEVLERQRKEALDQQYADVSAHRESAGSKLNQTIEQVLQLTENCTSLQIQNSKLTQELAVCKGDILNKNRDVERLTAQNDTMTKELEDLRKEFADIRADKANLDLKKNIWEKDRERLEEDLKKARKDLEKVRTQKEDLKENCIKMEHQLEQNKLTIQDLHSELEEQLQPPPEFNFLSGNNSNHGGEDELSPLPILDKGNLAKSSLETSFECLMEQIIADRERMSMEETQLQSQLEMLRVPLDPPDDAYAAEFDDT